MEEWEIEDGRVDARANELTRKVIGALIAVHRELGAGYSEAIYQRAVAIELTAAGLRFKAEHPFEVTYRGEVIGAGRMDFLIEDCLVLELKTVDTINPVHRSQVLTYMRANNLKLGLLANFHVPVLKEGLRRYVF